MNDKKQSGPRSDGRWVIVTLRAEVREGCTNEQVEEHVTELLDATRYTDGPVSDTTGFTVRDAS